MGEPKATHAARASPGRFIAPSPGSTHATRREDLTNRRTVVWVVGRIMPMPRPIQALIHTAALAHNLAVARQRVPDSRVWAVVKARPWAGARLPGAAAR